MKSPKIVIQTRIENIEIESTPFVFWFQLGGLIRLLEAPKKDDFLCTLFFLTVEIIKMKEKEES